MDNLSDAQLVKRTLQRKGDAALAFAKLYGRYHVKIAAYIGAKVNYNKSIIEDVQQETFTIAWNKLEQLKDVEKFFPWLVTISRNAAMDVLREKKRVNELEAILKIDNDDKVDELISELGDTEQLLTTLEPLDREVVVLKVLLEYSFEEISNKLSLSISATKMRYYRALDKLKALQ